MTARLFYLWKMDYLINGFIWDFILIIVFEIDLGLSWSWSGLNCLRSGQAYGSSWFDQRQIQFLASWIEPFVPPDLPNEPNVWNNKNNRMFPFDGTLWSNTYSFLAILVTSSMRRVQFQPIIDACVMIRQPLDRFLRNTVQLSCKKQS